MKIDKVVIAGCSWMGYPWEWENKHRKTYNPSIPERHDNRDIMDEYGFGRILTNKLNTFYGNISEIGHSNEKQINMLHNLVENNRENKKLLVIFGITQLSRFEIWANNHNIHENTVTFKWHSDFSERYSSLRRGNFTKRELQEFIRLGNRIYFDHNWMSSKVMRQFDFLNGYLNSKGHEFLLFDSFSELIFDEKPYMFRFPNEGYQWMRYIHSYDKDYRVGTHPSHHDHKVLADLLSDYLEKKYEFTKISERII